MESLRVLVVAPFAYVVSSEKYFVNALTRLGHQVSTVPTARAREGLTGAEHDVGIVVGPPAPKAASWRGRAVYVQMDHLSRGHAGTNWQRAHKVGYDAYFNPHLLGDPGVCIDKGEELRGAHHRLRLGYDPDAHARVPWAAGQDVSFNFVATYRPERAWVINVAGRLGGVILGNDWPPGVSPGAVHGAPYHALLAQSRVALNQHYPGDAANLRFYEALAMGCLLLTDKHPPGEDWVPGKHFLQYDDTAHAAQLLEEWAAKPVGERARVADAGHAHVKGSTWDAAMQRLLEEALGQRG